MVVELSSLLGGCFFAAAVLAVVYWLSARKLRYWEQRGVPSVRQWPLIGSVPGVLLLRDNLSSALCKVYEQMSGKPFFGMYFLSSPVLVVRDQELAKCVLVKDAHVFLDRAIDPQEDVNPLMARNLASLNGRKWRDLRIKLTPTFTSSKMKKMFYLMDECAKHLTVCLQKEASTGGGVLDVKDMMYRYSTDSIASCAFGVRANALEDPDCEFRTVLKGVITLDTLSKKIVGSVMFLAPALVKLFKLKLSDDDVCDFVRKMFWNVVDDRKKTGLARGDFVDLMINLKEDGEVRADDMDDLREINQENERNNTTHFNKDQVDVLVEDDDFVAQAFVFLIAGLEGAASVLTFTLYELAHNLDVQEKLRQEITSVVDKHDRQMSYSAIADMSYLDMVISETLRKYPPTGFLGRKCLSDYKLPGTEITIEKGTSVMISVAGFHADPSIYPDPQKYDPERFNAENKSKRSPYVYLPFGAGPRNCIGMRFSIIQTKIALARILASHQVRTCAQTVTPPLRFKVHALALESQDKIILEFARLNTCGE